MTERTLAEQTTEQIAMPVNATGGRFMLNGRTYEGGAAHGYDGFEFYVHGRAGAMALLGEPLSAELITVEFGPFYPPFIKQMWESGEAKHSPEIAAKFFIEQGYLWAEHNLSPQTDWQPLIEIAQQVFSSTPWQQAAAIAYDAGSDVTKPALRLVAGWSQMEWPDDPRHGALHAINLLRELRGGLHLIHLHDLSCDPLQIVLHRGTEINAQIFGWPEPYPEVTEESKSLWEEAEARTHRDMVQFFEPLSAEDQSRLVQLIISASTRDTSA